MLFDGKRPGIKGHTKYSPSRHVSRPQFSQRKGYQLRDERTDGHGGIAKVQELVDAGHENRPREADDPSPEGRDWDRSVVGVGDRRTHFWVRRVVVIKV